MRQLFVPACLCLMMSSNTTGFDLPLDKFAGASTFDKRVLMRKSDAGASNESEASDGAAFAVADIPSDADASQSGAADVAGDGAGRASAALDMPDSVVPKNVPLPPVAKPVIDRSRAEICDTLAKAAHSNDLPVPFFIRLLFQESRFNPAVVSSAGAQGIAQFMPETSASEGLVNPFDPLQAIPASARLLRKLFEQFGNLGLAAAAYNAGPKRIQDWLAKKGKLPEETQGYVKTVTGRRAETWRVASASGTELTLPSRAPCKEAVPPAPKRPHAIVASARHAASAARKKEQKTAKASPHHAAPTQQLTARKHKSKHTNQKLAQR